MRAKAPAIEDFPIATNGTQNHATRKMNKGKIGQSLCAVRFNNVEAHLACMISAAMSASGLEVPIRPMPLTVLTKAARPSVQIGHRDVPAVRIFPWVQKRMIWDFGAAQISDKHSPKKLAD